MLKNANVTQLKFHVPESCQGSYWNVVAICEAHFNFKLPPQFRRIRLMNELKHEKIIAIWGRNQVFLNVTLWSFNEQILPNQSQCWQMIFLKIKSELNIKVIFNAIARNP